MSIINGTQIMLYIDGQPIFAGVSNDESASNDVREVTSKMSGGVAEFDYGKFNAQGSAEGLFAEVMKNIAQYPEDFSNALWVATGCTKTAFYGTVPNGKKVSGRVTSFSNGDTFLQYIDGGIFNVSSTEYVFSIWLKGTAGQTCTIRLYDEASMDESLQVTLTTGFVRVEIAGTSTGLGSDIFFGIINDTDTATGVEFAQPQLEIGIQASAYQESGKLYLALYNALSGRTKVGIKVGSLVVGSVYYIGQAAISDLKRTEQMEANTTFSLSYKVSGELTPTTIS